MGKGESNNAVQQNRIQAEFIKKELDATKLRTNFTLNVRRMAQEIVSEKVNAPPRVHQSDAADGKPTEAPGAMKKPLADAGRSMLKATPREREAKPPGEVPSATPSVVGSTTSAQEKDEEAAREAQLMAELVEQIMKPKLTPRQIYPEPITTSMRIGWDLTTVVEGGSSRTFQMQAFRTGPMATRWRRPKVATELSRYCRDYVKMNGYGPYAIAANN